MAAAEIRRAVDGAALSVEFFLDSVGTWLTGVPANPVTEFLSGALWLVRRTLFPVGSDVGIWGSVPCVATKDCSGQDLRFANFSYLDISGVDFTGANLIWTGYRSTKAENAIFAGANLNSAKFWSTNFRGADFTGATLNNVQVMGVQSEDPLTDFTGANFTDATMRGFLVPFRQGVTLVNANLTNVDLSSPDGFTNLWYSDLTGATLNGARLERSLFMYANFTDADLTGANLNRATLVSANLTEANLSGATLVWTNLRDAIWNNTTCPDGSKTNTGCAAL